MEACDPTAQNPQSSQKPSPFNSSSFSTSGLRKSPEQVLAEHPVRRRLALQERQAQQSSNRTLRTVFKKVVWSTYNSVMKLRTNRERNTANNGNKKNGHLPGEAELEELVDCAEYEIHQDPYRGMMLKFAPSFPLTTGSTREAKCTGMRSNGGTNGDGMAPSSATSSIATSNNTPSNALGKDDGSTVTTTSTPTISNCTSPWTRCQWGSATMASSGMVVPSSATSSSINNSFLNQDPQKLVLQVCHCSCPSLEAWTRSKIAKSTKKSGRKRGRTSAAAASKSQQDDPSEELNEMIRLIQVSGRHELSQSQEQQPISDRYRCVCDYNPFCLGSLGGVIDDVLTERSLEVAMTALTARRTHREILGDGGKGCEVSTEVVVDGIDVDEGISQPGSRESQTNETHPTSAPGDVKAEAVPLDCLQFLDQKKRSRDEGGDQDYNMNRGRDQSTNIEEDCKRSMVASSASGTEQDVFAFLGDEEPASKSGIVSPSNKRRRDSNNHEDYRHGDEEQLIVPTPPLKRQRHADDVGDDYAGGTTDEKELSAIVTSVFNSETNETSDIHDLTGTDHSTDSSGNSSILTIPVYSKQTQEDLNRLRKSLTVQVGPIRSYVYRTLGVGHVTGSNCGNEDDLKLDEYMDKLKNWYGSILFQNPLDVINQPSTPLNGSSDRLTIALPPGIQNLGATCYLNTQLQCLAQNTAFLKGIFSWRNHQETENKDNGTLNENSNKKNNVMNSVMSRLQLLLARMVLGGDRKVSTIDFSNALGLEHDEQQDPNEFARLLFERMDESFQECAAASRNRSRDEEDVSENGGDLSNLMHRIFHGVTTYETTCMTCNTTSVRREGFMDVNIPITKPKKAETSDSSSKGDVETKKGGRQTTILESLNPVGGSKSDGSASPSKKLSTKNVDTELQYCLDQYAHAEYLENDNQYWCSSCDCKRDAKRELKFTELPPVLNVQLSRYVFDREKYVKKKLSDKVLLPTVLRIPNATLKGDSMGEGSHGKDQYLLCAVMRHQGTSAYHGHYVAEAMDWSTGRWFEFNDEVVKLLPDGPSCSYDSSNLPHSKVDDQNDFISRFGSLKDASGSQDAYNMYYVQSSFLVKNATSSLLQREQLLASINARKVDPVANDAKYDALFSVSKHRDSQYSLLSEKCFADWQASDRLRRRRRGIRQVMFPDAGALSTSPSSGDNNVRCTSEKRTDEFPIWVNSDPLRKFLSCGIELDRHLHGHGPLLRHKHLLCEHDGLHPRVARRGKLLPRPMYDAYVSLLEGERNLLRKQRGSPPGVPDDEANSDQTNDCVITPDTHLFCKECSQSYRSELAHKLEFIKCLKMVFEDLDTKMEDCSLEYDEDEEPLSCPEDGFAYAISKQFVTKFRKEVTATLKTLANFVEGATLSFADDGSVKSVISEGLDAVDISVFQFDKSDAIVGPKEKAKSTKEEDKLDSRVNTAISCPHGRFDISKNKRSVRYISWNVWSTLKKIFPDAIEHKRKRISSKDDDLSVEADLSCPLCDREKLTLERMKAHLEDWAKETSENPELWALYSSKADTSREDIVHNFTNKANGCRIVHIEDIKTWRKAVSGLADIDKLSAGDCPELKAQVEQLAFPNTHSVVLDFEREPCERLLASLRSLNCTEHHLVISSVVFQERKPGGKSQLSKNIIVLSDAEHGAYIASLTSLLRILYDEDEGLAIGSISSPVVVDDVKNTPKYMQHVKQAAESYHPSIRLREVKEENSSPNALSFSLQNSDKLFTLSPNVCNCETCKNEFASLRETTNGRENPRDKDPTLAKIHAASAGAVAADPILVESDAEDPPPNTFELRVFELDKNGHHLDAIKALEDIQALQTENVTSADGKLPASWLRRSTRKRKSRFPVGPLLSESSVRIGLHYNFAAIKLLLYEGCEVPVFGYRISLVVALDDTKSPEWVDVEPSWASKELKEVVDDLKLTGQHDEEVDFEPSKSLFLMYRKEVPDSDSNIGETNASVMDSLLELSNISTPNDSSKKPGDSGKGKRNRPAERGFRGTLLQASSGLEPKEDSENGDPDDQKEAPKTDISEVSDEEKELPRVVVEDVAKRPAAVLNEDSSGDESAIPSPSGLHRPSDGSVNGEHNGTHMIEVDKDDSSVEEQNVRNVAQPSPGSSNASPVVAPSLDSMDVDPSLDNLISLVVRRLFEIVENPDDESKCWDAASWAAKSNPSGTINELVDSAFAKYINDQGD